MLDCVLYVRRARDILCWYDFDRQRKVSRVLGQQLLFKYGKYNRVVGSLHIYDCHTSQITSGQCITKCSVLLHMRVSNDLCKNPYMKCSICSSVRGRRPLCWRVGVGLFLYMKPAIERELLIRWSSHGTYVWWPYAWSSTWRALFMLRLWCWRVLWLWLWCALLGLSGCA